MDTRQTAAAGMIMKGAAEANPRKPLVVVVTGLSGAGKSTALHTLEDLGFFCVDNLPTRLAAEAVALCERGGMTRIALGIDARVRAFLTETSKVLAQLEHGGQRDVQMLFLDASDEALVRRFSETRRPHPLHAGTSGPSSFLAGQEGHLAVLEGVQLERARLAPLRAQATRLIDTTQLSIHDLRRALIDHFGAAAGLAPHLYTRIVSFGFKYGTPVDADLVFDVRFLENPHFVPELKALAGTDKAVSDFVLGLSDTRVLLAKCYDLLSFVLPRYEREGRSYLTIGIGCTGGRHRSVAIAEELGRLLRGLEIGEIVVVHRDLARGEASLPPESYKQPPSSAPNPQPSQPELSSDPPSARREP